MSCTCLVCVTPKLNASNRDSMRQIEIESHSGYQILQSSGWNLMHALYCPIAGTALGGGNLPRRNLEGPGLSSCVSLLPADQFLLDLLPV